MKALIPPGDFRDQKIAAQLKLFHATEITRSSRDFRDQKIAAQLKQREKNAGYLCLSISAIKRSRPHQTPPKDA